MTQEKEIIGLKNELLQKRETINSLILKSKNELNELDKLIKRTDSLLK